MLLENSALLSDCSLAVEINSLSKSYGNITVLSSLNLSIAPGERVALIGPSGSGKTTLLRLIAGLTETTQGTVSIHGKPIEGLKPGKELASLVGMVSQQFDLVPNISVLNNVLAGKLGQWGILYSIVSLIWPREKHLALQALERVGIDELWPQRTSLLSGGEQQRVAIARVLLQGPKIVLADEPVSSLDPARAEETLQLLVDLTKEKKETLIASVHGVGLARSYFDRVVGLRDGSVFCDLPAKELTEQTLKELYRIHERAVKP